MKKTFSMMMLFSLALSFTSCSKVVKIAKPLVKATSKSEKIGKKNPYAPVRISPNIGSASSTYVPSERDFVASRSLILGSKIVRKQINKKERKKMRMYQYGYTLEGKSI